MLENILNKSRSCAPGSLRAGITSSGRPEVSSRKTCSFVDVAVFVSAAKGTSRQPRPRRRRAPTLPEGILPTVKVLCHSVALSATGTSQHLSRRHDWLHEHVKRMRETSLENTSATAILHSLVFWLHSFSCSVVETAGVERRQVEGGETLCRQSTGFLSRHVKIIALLERGCCAAGGGDGVITADAE